MLVKGKVTFCQKISRKYFCQNWEIFPRKTFYINETCWLSLLFWNWDFRSFLHSKWSFNILFDFVNMSQKFWAKTYEKSPKLVFSTVLFLLIHSELDAISELDRQKRLIPVGFAAATVPLVRNHFIIGRLLECQCVRWRAEEVNEKSERAESNSITRKINSSHQLLFHFKRLQDGNSDVQESFNWRWRWGITLQCRVTTRVNSGSV